MTAISLDIFAAVAVDKSERAQTIRQVDSERSYVEVANLLLEMHWDAVEVTARRAQAARIAARLDDPATVGSPAQRGAAEARHWCLTQDAFRLERDHVKRDARAVARKFSEMSADQQVWMVDELARAWHDSPLFGIVRTDQNLGRDPIWTALIRAADLGPVNAETPPF